MTTEMAESIREIDQALLHYEFPNLASTETLSTLAWMVARGVCSIVFCGNVCNDFLELGSAREKLDAVIAGSEDRNPVPVVPLIIETPYNAWVYFAANQEVADTFRWVHGNAPEPHCRRILRLMESLDYQL